MNALKMHKYSSNLSPYNQNMANIVRSASREKIIRVEKILPNILMLQHNSKKKEDPNLTESQVARNKCNKNSTSQDGLGCI